METAAKYYFLLDSGRLNKHDKTAYRDLSDKNMNEGALGISLRKLSGMMEKHYGTKQDKYCSRAKTQPREHVLSMNKDCYKNAGA